MEAAARTAGDDRRLPGGETAPGRRAGGVAKFRIVGSLRKFTVQGEAENRSGCDRWLLVPADFTLLAIDLLLQARRCSLPRFNLQNVDNNQQTYKSLQTQLCHSPVLNCAFRPLKTCHLQLVAVLQMQYEGLRSIYQLPYLSSNTGLHQ